METTLHIALVQTTLVWEDPMANRKLLEEKLAALSPSVDLIILPEMFSTGFSMNASKVCESMQGPTIAWMQQQAAKHQAALCGSIIIEEKRQYYNRLVFAHPDGQLETYDKRHCFSYAGEDKIYTPGDQRLIITYKGWKLCPLICYDLRFPVWSRNSDNYDLLIYIANWPDTRIKAWDQLLSARAIENMAYSIGVNRYGTDANNLHYNGHSAIYNPLGERLIFSDKEAILQWNLDKEALIKLREQFRFLQDRDRFTVN